MKETGEVIIVGAGPGDPELITVKGMTALQKADVILYDALVSIDLLKCCKRDCKHIYVGKRKGKKEFPQEEINSLLVFYAQRYPYVVRLKGGDPYVFGRGHEEAAYVASYGITTHIVPGISSAIAAPSAAGIPLTKRGVNESFWVITGTLSSGEMSHDLNLAAKSSATIVVLMGVTHLSRIASLICESRSFEEPMAIIANATTSQQKIIVGNASNITTLTQEAGVSSPAVIIIGKVVEDRKSIISLMEDSKIMSYTINE
jgi:uroporphyrin-III C-methyltransferase